MMRKSVGLLLGIGCDPGVSERFYPDAAGKDCTDVFFGLHRQEVLQKPAYRRLNIGSIKGQKENIFPRAPGDIRTVPYSEPSWLMPGFKSPYFRESHHRFLKEVRKFMDEVVIPDSEARDPVGKIPDTSIFEKCAALNIPAMRLGPGPHLKGLTLMNGTVTPEEARSLADQAFMVAPVTLTELLLV